MPPILGVFTQLKTERGNNLPASYFDSTAL